MQIKTLATIGGFTVYLNQIKGEKCQLLPLISATNVMHVYKQVQTPPQSQPQSQCLHVM